MNNLKPDLRELSEKWFEYLLNWKNKLPTSGCGERVEIILKLQQSAQPHNTEAGTQIDRQISQLVEGASGWQLWAIGCWTTIGKTAMEQGQKIAHFYATQPWLSHGECRFKILFEIYSLCCKTSREISWALREITARAFLISSNKALCFCFCLISH